MNSVKKRFDYLWLMFFIIIFINGFEAGGYQASMLGIGNDFDLSNTTKGLYASVELFATMLAPIILGGWADRTGKVKSIIILLLVEFVAAIVIFFTVTQDLFVVCVFFLGLTTSALQFITIAALADSYPITSKKKIGFMTAMYAFGAFVAPLVVKSYLAIGLHWRTLFAFLAVGSFVAFVGVFTSGSEPREVAVDVSSGDTKPVNKGRFILVGILLLCLIMCIYVGFENGFAYFVDTFFDSILMDDRGKFALSLFWAIMIPARVLVGYFSKYVRTILFVAVCVIPFTTIFISNAPSGMTALLLCIPLGLASGAIYPCVLSIMLGFAGNKTGTATGMITTATGIGGFAFTALTGFLADKLGLRLAIISLAGFFILSLIAVILTGKIEKNEFN